jgi:hypothetical protein
LGFAPSALFEAVLVSEFLFFFEFLLARIFVLFWFFEVVGRDIIWFMVNQCICRGGMKAQGILIPRYRL